MQEGNLSTMNNKKLEALYRLSGHSLTIETGHHKLHLLHSETQ